MKNRSLSLKRDVLQELTTDELAGVTGGTRETLYSCLAFISCGVVECLPTIKDRCIE